MNATEILTKARRLLVRGWCQRCPATDAAGVPVSSALNPHAFRFDLEGALAAADGGANNEAYEDACGYLRMMLWAWGVDGTLQEFNDAEATTQERVLALFDAVLSCERETIAA